MELSDFVIAAFLSLLGGSKAIVGSASHLKISRGTTPERMSRQAMAAFGSISVAADEFMGLSIEGRRTKKFARKLGVLKPSSRFTFHLLLRREAGQLTFANR